MSVAVGFAVVQGGVIDVRTVSPTRRGALVNWLVVAVGLAVRSDWSDYAIERAWDTCVLRFPGNECRHVTIMTTDLSTSADVETPA